MLFELIDKTTDQLILDGLYHALKGDPNTHADNLLLDYLLPLQGDEDDTEALSVLLKSCQRARKKGINRKFLDGIRRPESVLALIRWVKSIVINYVLSDGMEDAPEDFASKMSGKKHDDCWKESAQLFSDAFKCPIRYINHVLKDRLDLSCSVEPRHGRRFFRSMVFANKPAQKEGEGRLCLLLHRSFCVGDFLKGIYTQPTSHAIRNQYVLSLFNETAPNKADLAFAMKDREKEALKKTQEEQNRFLDQLRSFALAMVKTGVAAALDKKTLAQFTAEIDGARDRYKLEEAINKIIAELPKHIAAAKKKEENSEPALDPHDKLYDLKCMFFTTQNGICSNRECKRKCTVVTLPRSCFEEVHRGRLFNLCNGCLLSQAKTWQFGCNLTTIDKIADKYKDDFKSRLCPVCDGNLTPSAMDILAKADEKVPPPPEEAKVMPQKKEYPILIGPEWHPGNCTFCHRWNYVAKRLGSCPEEGHDDPMCAACWIKDLKKEDGTCKFRR